MSVGILSKNILVWDVIYISIGNFRCSIMKVCGNFCMSMASADKCFLIPPRITRSISSNERLSFKKIHASWACRGCALKNFCEFLAKKFVNSKKVRTFATLSAGKGRLAQLVQSVCLTSRGSGVRIPQRPPIIFSIYRPILASTAEIFIYTRPLLYFPTYRDRRKTSSAEYHFGERSSESGISGYRSIYERTMR